MPKALLVKPHIMQNNLYDSVINEVEKIASYENALNKFNEEEDKIGKLSGYDIDIMGFILLKNQEIMSDKLLRSFVNINHAIERSYTSCHCDLSLGDKTTVTYKPEAIKDLHKNIEGMIHLKTVRLFYDKDVNKKLDELSSTDFVADQAKNFLKFLTEPETQSVTVSTDNFVKVIDELYEDITNFMMIMRCELESKTNLYSASIVMKRVFGLTIMLAMAVGDFDIE